jgi:hypothetical protein
MKTNFSAYSVGQASSLPLVPAGWKPAPRSFTWTVTLFALLIGWQASVAQPPTVEQAPQPQPLNPANAIQPWELPPVPPPPEGRDPFLDRPDAQPPGWFTNLEMSIARPHLRDRLHDESVIAGTLPANPIVVPPDARLDWAAEPKVEVGYRLPDGAGDFRVSYRFLLDDGNGQSETRLDLHVVDFDYTTWEFSPWPHWEMNWTVGIEFATLFFDSHFSRPFGPDGAAGLTEEQASNMMRGAGPRTALDLTWQTPWTGWSLYAQGDAAELYVLTTQTFRESVLPATGGAVYGLASVRKPQGVPELGAQFGVKYEPPGCERWNFFAGYEWEGWWSVGRNDVEGSRADLFQNGIVFRVEHTF